MVKILKEGILEFLSLLVKNEGKARNCDLLKIMHQNKILRCGRVLIVGGFITQVKKGRKETYYSITEKGRKLLCLF